MVTPLDLQLQVVLTVHQVYRRAALDYEDNFLHLYSEVYIVETDLQIVEPSINLFIYLLQRYEPYQRILRHCPSSPLHPCQPLDMLLLLDQ